MKVLILINSRENYQLFSSIFKNNTFFDIDYSNFIPENQYYDTIISENSIEDMKIFKETPILLLKNSLQISGENILLLKEISPENIIKTLKIIYETSIKPNLKTDLVIYKDEIQFYNHEKRLIINVNNENSAIKRILNSLKNFNLNEKILNQIIFILSEFLVYCDLENITIVFQFETLGIRILLPEFIKNTFGINLFCNNLKKIPRGMEIYIKN